jgi:hypothetical protein
VLRCWVLAADAAEAELDADELMDRVVERQVFCDPPELLVPVLGDVEVVGAAPPADA